MGTKWTCFDNSSGYVCYHVTGEYFSFASSTGFKLFAELYTDFQYVNVHLHIMHFSTYMYIHGRAFCLECGVSWVQIPSEAIIFLWKSDCLPGILLLCWFVWPCLLLSSFLLHV